MVEIGVTLCGTDVGRALNSFTVITLDGKKPSYTKNTKLNHSTKRGTWHISRKPMGMTYILTLHCASSSDKD